MHNILFHLVSFSLHLSLSCLMKRSATDVWFGVSCIEWHWEIFPVTPELSDLSLNSQHNTQACVQLWKHELRQCKSTNHSKGQRKCSEGTRTLCSTLSYPCPLVCIPWGDLMNYSYEHRKKKKLLWRLN